MLKQHVHPCATCPFLKKHAGTFFSGRRRVSDIARALRNDKHFLCHKTLDYDREHPEFTGNAALCAGSLIVTEKGGGRPSQMARIQVRLNLLDWVKVEKIARQDTKCFDSLDAFVEGHTP